jgi:Ca2+-binding RTX toxin-like protein
MATLTSNFVFEDIPNLAFEDFIASFAGMCELGTVSFSTSSFVSIDHEGAVLALSGSGFMLEDNKLIDGTITSVDLYFVLAPVSNFLADDLSIDLSDIVSTQSEPGESGIAGAFQGLLDQDWTFTGTEYIDWLQPDALCFPSGPSLNLRGNDIISLGDGNDIFHAGDGNDVLFGGTGNDTLFGGAGNDLLDGGTGNDTMAGGLGNDIYIVDSLGDVVTGEVGFAQGGGIDTVITSVDFTLPANVEIARAAAGVAGLDLTGNDAPNTLVGNDLANVLTGRGGNDQINGNGGNDTLIGGEGRDTLVGGTGADTFVYLAVSNSRAGAANRDVINGFDRGAVQDRIDLSAIDANTGLAGLQDFTFIGTAAFTAAGQVRVQSLGGPNACIVEVNVNANLGADMQIFVNLQTTMVAGDFIL